MIKASPAIVLACIAQLRANITALDPRQDLPSVQVSHLDHEWLHSVVSFTDLESAEDDTMAAEHAKIAWPVFRRLEAGSVNHELICFFVESGSREQSCDV